MKKVEPFFAPTGLHYARPPPESFLHLAYQRSGILACRQINAFHMMRIHWCIVADRQVNILLDNARTKDNLASFDGWFDFQQTLERIVREEADLILATLPFYIPPGDDPLNPTHVCPLIWPLSTLGLSRQVSSSQKQHAGEALFQIGARAKLPIATKLAKGSFADNAEPYHSAQILHYTWHC
jgi:hypothetical protein